MWKKDEEPNPTAGASTATGSPAPSTQPKRPLSKSAEPATIGRSITIRGDVTGDEDLFIQGRIEGTIDLKQHNVTVGPEGRVKANIKGRMVTIEGEVDGNVSGQEQVALRSASKVNGDIVAPRVVLEDGANFLGSIDMSGKPVSGNMSRPTPVPSERAKTDPVPTSPTAESTGAAKA